MKDIVIEGNPLLNQKCEKVDIPFKDEDKKVLLDLLGYVINSQNEETQKKFNLRPAVGLAAPQIGVLKRMFAIVTNDFDDKTYILPLVNPIITKRSKEMVYLPLGEGCISVTRDTNNMITPRHKTIEIKALKYNIEKNKLEPIKMTLSNYISIVFQHEYDHLDGILYTQKMYDNIPNCTPLYDINENEED